MDKETEIAYQKKDIMSKVLAEEFKGKSFEVYGVKLPKIVDSRPTEMAAVEANELRLDRLFRLEDGSFLIVDYESVYGEVNKIKYMGYITRVMKTLYKRFRRYPRLRILIIYTADVTRDRTRPDLELGAVSIHLEEAFLSEIDGDEVYSRVISKIDKDMKLNDIDVMQLIVYPLTYKKKGDKQNAIQRIIQLLDRIEDELQRVFIIKCLLVFCDKLIQDNDADKIRSMLMLTKVEQIIEKEKQDAIEAKAVEVKINVAKNLLNSGSTPEYVADNTGMTLEAVIELQKNL